MGNTDGTTFHFTHADRAKPTSAIIERMVRFERSALSKEQNAAAPIAAVAGAGDSIKIRTFAAVPASSGSNQGTTGLPGPSRHCLTNAFNVATCGWSSRALFDSNWGEEWVAAMPPSWPANTRTGRAGELAPRPTRGPGWGRFPPNPISAEALVGRGGLCERSSNYFGRMASRAYRCPHDRQAVIDHRRAQYPVPLIKPTRANGVGTRSRMSQCSRRRNGPRKWSISLGAGACGHVSHRSGEGAGDGCHHRPPPREMDVAAFTFEGRQDAVGNGVGRGGAQ